MIRTTRTNDSAEVESDLRDALDITKRLDPPDDLRVAVFEKAATLLTHRIIEQVGASPLAAGAILPGR